MKPRFALPTVLFATSVFGLPALASAESVGQDAPASAETPAAASADNPSGFLGVAVAESVAPPDAGPDVPSTVLLVSGVMPGSAADAAGLRTGDVLLKIDGQHLLHPVQLRRLVELHPAGREVEMTVFRDGQQVDISATLGERPADLTDLSNDGPGLGPADGALPEDFDWLRPQPAPIQLDLEQMQQRMDRQFEQMRQMFRQGMDDGWPGGDMWERADPIDLDLHFEAIPMGQRVTVLQDNDHKLTVTQTQDGRHLKATDPQGRVLFDGPIDTPAQLNAVPQELRHKLPAPGEAEPMNLRLLRPFDPAELFERLAPNPGGPAPADNDGPGEELPAPAGRAV
ncbi:MAG: PDZ domain-containing protein [Planctomycetota bacterium]